MITSLHAPVNAGIARHEDARGATRDDDGGSSVWWDWVMANSVGETLGLGVAAIVALALAPAIARLSDTTASTVSALVIVTTGAIEGYIVGSAQWSVLRDRFRSIDRSAWVRATVLGAVVAWMLGVTPMLLSSITTAHGNVVGEPTIFSASWIAMSAALGLMAGLILALFQWRVLRRHAERSSIWLPANSLAWSVGMPMVFATIQLVMESGDATRRAIPTAILGLLLTGAVVGAIHGVALMRMKPREAGSLQ